MVTDSKTGMPKRDFIRRLTEKQRAKAERYIPFAWKFVNKFHRGLYEKDDLFQEAMIDLCDAIVTYKPDKGMEFTSWAWLNMKRAINRLRTKEKKVSASNSNTIVYYFDDMETWKGSHIDIVPIRMLQNIDCLIEARCILYDLYRRYPEETSLLLWSQVDTMNQLGKSLGLSKQRIHQRIKTVSDILRSIDRLR